MHSQNRAISLPAMLTAGTVFWCFVWFVEASLWDQQRLVRQYPVPLLTSVVVRGLIGTVLAAILWLVVLRRIAGLPTPSHGPVVPWNILATR